MIRVVTWNVRHCRGHDRRVKPERVISLLSELEPDVIALQEVDLDQPRSGAIDQADLIATALGMTPLFCRTLTCDAGEYGHALLTRLRVESWRSVSLPCSDRSEPRSFIEAELVAGRSLLHVCSTHLSLARKERIDQARAIADVVRDRTVVLGDLNSGRGQAGYAQLASTLVDPLRGGRRTWPAFFPVLALDHILVSPAIDVVHAARCDAPKARYASDHRPIFVDLAA
jgi:endonuclease/exonuclease/phosphatase family metal-dependent hydrolase